MGFIRVAVQTDVHTVFLSHVLKSYCEWLLNLRISHKQQTKAPLHPFLNTVTKQDKVKNRSCWFPHQTKSHQKAIKPHQRSKNSQQSKEYQHTHRNSAVSIHYEWINTEGRSTYNIPGPQATHACGQRCVHLLSNVVYETLTAMDTKNQIKNQIKLNIEHTVHTDTKEKKRKALFCWQSTWFPIKMACRKKKTHSE